MSYLIGKLPQHMHGAIMRWINNGTPPGDFLTALLSNDLRETFAKADDTNALCIKDCIIFFYNAAPSGCWGSPENVQSWAAHNGLKGLRARHQRVTAEDDPS